MTVAAEKHTPSLRRQIGPVAMLFTGITSIIGSGWLFASLYAAQIAGPAAIISWFIGGGIALLMALVYAELGGMLPCAGAIARIPYFSHGGLSSFIAGWLCWVAYVATAPIEVAAVLQYASNYLPWLTTTVGESRVLTAPGLVAATVLLALFTGINLAGVNWLARANTTITLWKLAIPVLAATALMIAGFHSENFTSHGGFAPTGAAGVFAAVSGGGILFCFFGFRTAMDMAGEAKNPQRSVPLAMIGAVSISLLVYLLLQVAFIGAIPPAHLADGWPSISENAAAGPFAAFAALLGMQWLAGVLYFDAVLSPSGTGLAFTAATARINYAMAANGQFPRIFLRLNRFQIPAWALLFNLAVGFVLLLPFPGWAELVGFITSAAVLSLAFGPVSLTALRYQCPDQRRPFRLTPGLVLSPICFIITAYVVYWTGWDTNWKVFLLAALGGAGMSLVSLVRKEPREVLRARQSAWFWIYLAGLTVLSYLGNYGHGLGLLGHGLDTALLTVFALPVFWLAVTSRLPAEHVCAMIAEATS